VTVYLVPDIDRNDAADFCRQWSEALKARDINISGRRVWVQCDADEATKERRRAVAQALEVIRGEALVVPPLTLEPDWPGGAVYIRRDGDESEHIVGSWDNKKRVWKWHDEAIRNVWPSCSAEALSAALAAL
jgi:hypothetical protein